tara:strand:- start:1274 stop:1813 length:540 start_codon:yes stop_codon:yes gene_type:complete
MKILIEPQAKYCDTDGNRGVTCICAIETSHVVLHIWDETKPARLQLDIYTCSHLELPHVWNKIRQLKPFDIKYKFYDRDKNFTLLNGTVERRIQKNLLSNKWTFAKTMPQIPHWYTHIRDWVSKDKFAEAVDLINENGVSEKFGSKYYKYYYIDDHKYWTMEKKDVPSHEHILINRAKI